MDMDQLVEHYIQYRFHRYDESVAGTIPVLIQNLNDLDNKMKTLTEPNERLQAVRDRVQEYLTELEDETLVKECSFDRVSRYNFRHIRDSYRAADNPHVPISTYTLNERFQKALKSATIDNRDKLTYGNFLHENRRLLDVIDKRAKFSTKCCKYWHESYHQYRINGKCPEKY